MTWWKKILSTLPLLITRYEVGKSNEEHDNKELVEILKNNIKENNRHDQTYNNSNANNKLSYIELVSIIAIVVLASIYIIKIICKALINRH